MRCLTQQKGVDVTGIVAVVCARYAIFHPGAMVDLYVGEWYIISFCNHVPITHIIQ
ncbi:uncharacterized protein LACBIDRAFT_308443 [Laccaria bicolor S238N-H82]|uniref:Predicted protein n=1 Tax=Laccaria bicolor (strain S238N-H82 / ATCC MYA-4686) TaxID=486041 RepID=B0CWA5_LACBS|nr:uncharacterized protein LACBIDRAFT_308443 [Laccaria bicolor S238N-H82]EDR13476.1 predicted protein [Laccaria bicolor S238N-H82]|eukprot:XP_001875974.1 predicted protein [Laccaria bicolor S238N-H82]